MLKTSRNIRSILQRAVDESAEIRSIDEELSLSPFLSGSFNLYRANVLGTSVLLAEDVSGEDGLLKRLEVLEKVLGEPAAVIVPSATASEKKALMAMRRGFVTEQGDMYLPSSRSSSRPMRKRSAWESNLSRQPSSKPSSTVY